MKATELLARIGAVVSTVLLTSCRGLGAGGCEHVYAEPLFVIRSALDSASGASISEVLFSEFVVDGKALSVTYAGTSPPSLRVRVVGSELACLVNCGFGNSEGTWSFRVRAAGYRPRELQYSGRYRTFTPGCPSSNSGSVPVDVVLVKEA